MDDKTPYNVLRREAKKLGIPANGKKEVLLQKVLDANKRKRTAEDTPEGEPNAKIPKIGQGNNESKTEEANVPTQSVTLTTTTSAQEESAAVQKLIDSWRKSRDLAYQQSQYGTCLQKPLPLRESLQFENYFLDDIISTKVYDEFFSFTHTIRTSTHNDQTLTIGAVVQKSGYGKTHLARVYTRHNKAIYMKLSERQAANQFYTNIQTILNDLLQKHLGLDVAKRTGKHYADFTDRAGRAIKIFFLAAIEHYAHFYNILKNNNNEKFKEEDLTQMCAPLFDNGFGTLFMKRVNDYWTQLENLSWLTNLQQQITEMATKIGITAIFCDEVHSLMKEFIGLFFHTSPPTQFAWSPELAAARAAYEQHVVKHPDEKNSERFSQIVREAYKRPTSLTYLIVQTLEQISGQLKIGCILLTTHHAAIDYTESENSAATRGRATIADFKFEREPDADGERFDDLINTYFGINLDAHLQTLPEYSRIRETLSNRVVYWYLIINAIIDIGQIRKPSDMRTRIKEVWRKVEEASLRQAKDYLSTMAMNNSSIYYDVVYAALYHNGYLPHNLALPTKEDISYVPVVKEIPVPKEKAKYRLGDYWMIKQLNSTLDKQLHLQALNHAYRTAKSDGPLGEDLMKFIALTNRDTIFSSLAVQHSSFHKNSIAHQFKLQVHYAADASEYELSELEVLKNPKSYLLNRLIKVSDTVRPDGLAISELAGSFAISAWQSKHKIERLDAADIAEALESLDPKNFFNPESGDRKTWQAIRTDALWYDNFIRVVWATDFTASAINAINEYNTDAANINRPIILISHEILPKDYAVKYESLPPKQNAPRELKTKYSFSML